MNKHNFLVYAMSSWFEWTERGVTNTNRQIIKTLIKMDQVEKVVMVNYLPYSFKRQLREFIFFKIIQKNSNTILQSLFYRVDKINEKLIVISTINRNNRFINELLKKINFNNYKVWSFNPMNVDWLNHDKTKIFTAIDNWSHHPIYNKYQKRLLDNYEKIKINSDIIFTVSESLKNLFLGHNYTHLVPNAVDFEHFYASEKNKTKWNSLVNEDLFKDIKTPIIGYVGVIQDRFNIELLEYLLKNNKDKSFVIIGSLWKSIQNKFNDLNNKHDNLYLLGKVDYNIMPYYMNKFNVGIIPHYSNKLTQSMNPLKIYEYLACGLPIVSTNIAGSNVFVDLVDLTDDFSIFNQKINQALLTSDEKKNKFFKRAQEEDWSKRCKFMLETISQKQ